VNLQTAFQAADSGSPSPAPPGISAVQGRWREIQAVTIGNPQQAFSQPPG